MVYVFLIGTEHQLQQVNLAIIHYQIPKSKAILLIEKLSNNLTFIKKIEKSSSFNKVVIFESWIFYDIILRPTVVSQFKAICSELASLKILFFASHYDTDSTLLFNSIVKPREFILMDEGTASFTVFIRRNKNDIIAKFKLLLKSILYIKNISLPSRITYFTKFKFQVDFDKIVLYQFQKIINPLKQLNRNEFLFLGSSIVEVNLIDERIYLEKLANVLLLNRNNINHFIYLPHRREDLHKLNKINSLGFEIQHIDVPFEMYFQQQKKIAMFLASFFTTSVISNIADSNVNLPELFIYKFDLDLLKSQKQSYKYIYEDMLRHSNIHFVEI